MAKLVRLGSGYELWANTANDVVDKLDDILSVMKKSDHLNPSRNILTRPTWDAKSLPFLLLQSNSLFGAMTLV
jgi:hypothetical protein